MQISIETSIGNVRKSNQDYADYFINQVGHCLLILCDGMGGHNGGDVASEMAVNQMGHSWKSNSIQHSDEALEWLEDHFQIENDRIYQVSIEYDDLKGMGTTIVAAIFIHNQLTIANVGDSRAYLDNGKELKLLSEDHTFVHELVKKGEITEEEAAKHPNKNVLLQSMGVSNDLKIHSYQDRLKDGDQILLASDGLYEALTEEEILKTSRDLSLSGQEVVQHLVRLALKKDGKDNITLCLAQYKDGEELG